MTTIEPYKQHGVPVEPRPPRTPKDKYELLSMREGESRFWFGVTQQQISPYCTIFKSKKGLGTWTLRKDTREGRAGVEITRVSKPPEVAT